MGWGSKLEILVRTEKRYTYYIVIKKCIYALNLCSRYDQNNFVVNMPGI